ncbi:MAG: MBL fold metallo-hydrolase, partial [Bacteroidota bacterium]
CPPPDIHLPVLQASIQLIKSKGFDALYLTHFGLATDVENHLSELETRLLDWANWMKPYFENNANPAEVTPLFQAYVASQLEAAGIQGEDLEKYESANPAWMSVVGLLRYWRKATQA